jgi:hypothetical protein
MEIRCTQCGATLEVAPDARLLECTFCASALVVDGSGTLFHEVMRPTVRHTEVAAHLRRFLAGRDTVAGLDTAARIAEARLEYFPFWAFTVKTEHGERVVLEPAAPSSLRGLQGLELPAGDTRPATREATGSAPTIEPEVPLATAREWLANKVGTAEIRRTVLYHLPLYRADYQYKGRTYRASVEGVSGKVLPADFPAKAEAPYVLVAVLAIAVFGLEGLIIGNLLIKAVAYLVSAPPILAVAWLISKKV